MTSTFLNYLTFERTYGRPVEPRSVDTIDSNGAIAEEGDYFRQNIGKVSDARELLRDQRLYEYALTAFGLSDQIDNPEVVLSVLEGGIFDPFTRGNSNPNPINDLARAFWFSDDVLLPGDIEGQINAIASRYVISFGENAPANLTEELDFFRANAPAITSGEQLVRNERLFRFAIQAYGLNDEIDNRDLLAKALDAGGYNPIGAAPKLDAPANTLTDSRFRILAQAFAFNEVGNANVENKDFVDQVIGRYNTEALRLEARSVAESSRRTNAGLPPNEQRDIDYFRENIASVSSVDELLDDQRLYRFVLRAYDLESQIPFRGLIKKVLEDGVLDPETGEANPRALANQLVDVKFRELARGLGFAEVGSRNVRNPNFVQELIDRFTRVQLETDAGEQNIGVRLAAYFDRQGPRIDNWFAVLGDRALREVVFTAFDFPDAMQQTNPDRLVQLLEARFDIEDFKDPAKRQEFIQRFTVLYDIRNGAPTSVSNTLTLFGIDPTADPTGGQGVVSIDPATLSATLF